ncbi:4Fe-4S dicluster domain-containing protein [Denitrobacterium detoxificans]|uniref:4Fe-4S dicluster domain-containing protein n=1 Tax=Denitrobacterium detoxificans TaxID=79604 RepID=UPI0026F07C5F|nr:4Fe-4S dicluster domain-containing protein [Denitrobacterium detoxificans]MBE6466487.1 4Fe-4S dicluster domain-containing protein [Denitrobacterium detoxificans]
MSHYCIVVDVDHCTGCKGCEIACKNENNIPLGERWNRLLLCGPYGTYPNLSQYYLPVQCQQCENAPCVNVCPTGASHRDPETNIVQIDKEKCIGCKYCMMACPYSVRSFNEAERVVEKCTLCPQLTSQGKPPKCVRNCSVRCRYYGDLDDPESEVSKLLASRAEDVHHLKDFGNKPSSFYILQKKYCDWQEEPDWHDIRSREEGIM